MTTQSAVLKTTHRNEKESKINIDDIHLNSKTSHSFNSNSYQAFRKKKKDQNFVGSFVTLHVVSLEEFSSET